MLNIDQSISQFIVSFRLPALNEFMIFISFITEWGMAWIFLAMLFLKSGKKNGQIIFITLLVAIIIEVFLNDLILKQILYRPRPYLAIPDLEGLGILETTSSFVSGHTATAFSQVIVYFFLAKRYFLSVLIFAILVSFSRIFLGMHYFSDIIGGIILGLFSGWLALILVRNWLNNKKMVKYRYESN